MSAVPLSPDNRRWLDDFIAARGRAPRVLHIGNIANNAYNNARLMNAAGLDCDVICYDYYHVMGCPEWEDATISGEIDDISRPDWTRVDLHGFTRPSWFAQGPQLLCQDYLLARRSGSPTAGVLWRRLAEENRTGPPIGMMSSVVPTVGRVHKLWRRSSHLLSTLVVDPLVIEKLLAHVRRVLPGSRWITVTAQVATMSAALAAVAGLRVLSAPLRLARWYRTGRADEQPDTFGASRVVARLVADFAASFPTRPDQLQETDLLPYLGALGRWRALIAQYDVIQGYATDGIYPLLCGAPYAAFEHGTIRDIPFGTDQQARICAITYRKADVTFITNSDTLGCADRLGIAPERRVCLPHPFDASRLRDHAKRRKGALPGPPAIVTFFAPSRQHWRDGASSWLKGNDQVIRAAVELRNERLAFRIVFVEWGQEVALSKALIDSLGCGDSIEWIPPLRKRELWDRYLGASCVIDQFVMPAIGGVAFEAMSLGKRVITRIDESTLAGFFGATPPLLNATSMQEIAHAMRMVIADPHDEAGRGAEGSRWIDEFHSTERIVNLQVSAYRRLMRRAPRADSQGVPPRAISS